jgi:hypothetical protein
MCCIELFLHLFYVLFGDFFWSITLLACSARIG